MSEHENRARIERALLSPLSLIPADLQGAFKSYQLQHYWRFLLLVNLLGQAAYFSYGFADALLLPDIGSTSITVRSIFMALTLPLMLALFRWSRNVLLLDLLLPILILLATAIWFQLLAYSTSPKVATFQYASLIFIVLANLCVQVRFLPSLGISLLISVVILHGVQRLNGGNPEALLVFALVYLPVLFFSLFISWSTTLDRRRAFLRAKLDEMTRDQLAATLETIPDLLFELDEAGTYLQGHHDQPRHACHPRNAAARQECPRCAAGRSGGNGAGGAGGLPAQRQRLRPQHHDSASQRAALVRTLGGPQAHGAR